MDNSLRDYTPSENPDLESIPEGYQPCKQLGDQAFICAEGLVGCTAKCPYDSQKGGSIRTADNAVARPVCHTKGLVIKQEAVANE